MKNTCGEFDIQMIDGRSFNKTEITFAIRSVMERRNTTSIINFDDVNKSNENLCVLIHDWFHDVIIRDLHHVLAFISGLNSIMNPLIYAVWYEDFRKVTTQCN